MTSKNIWLAFISVFFLGTHIPTPGEAISLNFIKRGGKSCTGVCDQPSQVCGSDEKTKKWCKKYCSHKFKQEEVCAADWKVGEQAACVDNVSKEWKRARAARASIIAFSHGMTGNYRGGTFQEVENLNDENGTGLVGWSGIANCVLYISFRGSETKRDWYEKDLQIGVGTIAGKFGLGQVAARGPFNNAVKKGINFFHKVTQNANGDFKTVVITGHSLGGAIAMSVGDKVGREQENLWVMTFDAPGSAFTVNRKGIGHKSVQVEHIERGDIVSKLGQKTKGEKVAVQLDRAAKLMDHSMGKIAAALEQEARSSRTSAGS